MVLKRVEGRRRSECLVNGRQRFSTKTYRKDTDTSLTELGACANFFIERSESSFLLPEASFLVKRVHPLNCMTVGSSG